MAPVTPHGEPERVESVRLFPNLNAAFVAFQSEMTNPKKDVIGMEGNRAYKYADLANISEHIRPTLKKFGLAFQQPTYTDGSTVSVSTRLIHSSGEEREDPPLVWKVPSENVKALGATITYLRRYSLCACLGISSEEDSDGTTAGDLRNQQQTVQPQRQKTASIAATPATIGPRRDNVPIGERAQPVQQSWPVLPGGSAVSNGKTYDHGKMVTAISQLREIVGEKFYNATLSRVAGTTDAAAITSRNKAITAWRYLDTCARILSYQEEIGRDLWLKILGAEGYERPQDIVSPEEFVRVVTNMKAEADAARGGR